MAIDAARAAALELPSLTVTVERGRLRFFARTIGETDPVYLDAEAARAAGHPDVLIPPTFLFSLGLESPDPFGYLDALEIDLGRVLHGEQSFDYHALAYAGDELRLDERITDVYAKRGGALEFVTKTTSVTRAGEPIADLRSVIVVRNPEVTA
ncbi:MaoC family dehydratase N-terminal domain-containing protein [Tsukamurella ocularis]|uniref:MaoC family dehydratase N-terminal domain-containing protein n=1 Tax=Tsukamurella ocularis TaxID=1970234 RepID=UPI0039EFB885